jgi:hypothetical protein
MSVPQVVDLFFCQALKSVVAFPGCAHSILPQTVGDTAQCQDEGDYLPYKIDGVTNMVRGAVFGDVSPGRYNATNRSQCHNPARGNSAHSGTGRIWTVSAYNHHIQSGGTRRLTIQAPG